VQRTQYNLDLRAANKMVRRNSENDVETCHDEGGQTTTMFGEELIFPMFNEMTYLIRVAINWMIEGFGKSENNANFDMILGSG